MQKFATKLAVLLLAFGLTTNAIADGHERVIDVWTCTIKEGKTMDDVRASNTKWNKYMNANIDGGDIQSYIMTPVVGTRGIFMYADSYPSLASWAAGDALDNDELDAIQEELQSIATCSENALYKSEAS